MKYKIVIALFVLYSCTIHNTKIDNRTPYNSKGFAYIYNDEDFKNNIIKGKLDNSLMQVSHSNLNNNTLIKIINPKNNESLTIRNFKRIKYPDFYKILITEKVAEKLGIQSDFPLIEILEIKKNKSFIAKKAKIYSEEKRISSNAPVTSVQISNISKNKKVKSINKKDEFVILIGSFYRQETAKFLKQRIIKEIPDYDVKKLQIRKKSNKQTNLISGPYSTINFMKNDYILLKNFGFEELDIINYE
tara:strand:+ start:1436 stop:2173 length:738 start_codon:yes stop_codon:yes gene_type:complete